ncbi:O-antigen ligase family protein [Shewanella sp. HL-SH8]|uniref:O-antigen ligase family protein n=1 Tax=Shewanella sp. HL-SH8 TaxID=3436242 RepID=UPI003EC02FE8
MYKLIDHSSFALANVLLGSMISKFGTEILLEQFVISISFALFLYGFIKFVYINRLACGELVFNNSTHVGLLFYIFFSGCVGVVAFFLDLWMREVYVLISFFILMYLLIDYFRLYFLHHKKVMASAFLSCSYLLFIVSLYLISYITKDLSWLVIFLVYLVCTSSLISLPLALYINGRAIFGNFNSFGFSFIYWFSNSAISNVPLVLLTFLSPKVGVAFFALRTLYNAISTFLRPREVDFRMSLKEKSRTLEKIKRFLGSIIFLYSIFTCVMLFFYVDFFDFIYSNTFDITYFQVLFFSFYTIAIWMVVVVEGVYIQLNDIRSLAKARLLDLILLFMTLLLSQYFELELTAILALLTITSFPTFYLLYKYFISCKKGGELSIKLSSWHTNLIILCFFITDAVFRVRGYHDKSIDFQVVVKVLVYISIFLTSLYMLRFNKSNYYFKHNIAIFALICFFTISSFWSINVPYALVSSFSLVAYFCFITSYVSLYGVNNLLSCLLRSLFYFLLASFVFYFFVPSVGKISYWEFDVFVEGGRMSGIAGSANNLGRISCLSFIIAFYFYLRGNKQKIVYLVIFLSLLSLLLSVNRSSMLMVLASFAILTYNKKYRQVYSLFLLVFIASGFVVFLNFNEAIQLVSRSGNIDEILTFTGRTYIWNVVVELIKDNYFLGYGYSSSMFLLPRYSMEIGFSPSHAHNMILQILLYGGVIGILIFILSLFLFFKLNVSKLQFCLIIFVIYNGLLESGAFNGLVNITTVALFVAFNLFEREN